MAIASILVWPGILLNVAFQLSYGLTAIIIFLSKWQRAVLPRIRANLWVPIGMSLIALPLLCQYFFYWNALSILLTALFSMLFGDAAISIVNRLFCRGTFWIRFAD